MAITISSVLSLVFWGNLIIILTWIMSCIPSVFNRMNCQTMIWLLCITFLRFLFPGEFKYSISIGIPQIFQEAAGFIRFHLIKVGSCSLYTAQILFAIWILTAFLLIFRVIWKYIRFLSSTRQLIRSSQMISAKEITGCEFPKKIYVYKSRLISSPLITNLFRPVIFLPAFSLSDKELSLILQHELQHYKHRDLLLKAGVELLCILYWWNPAMHLLKKQLLLLLEMRADTEVCKTLSAADKICYLECLEKLCSFQSVNLMFTSGFAKIKKKSDLLKRAEYLTQEKECRLPLFAAFLFCFLFFCSLVFIIEPSSEWMEKSPDLWYSIYNLIGLFKESR